MKTKTIAKEDESLTQIPATEAELVTKDYLLVKADHKIYKVHFKDILYKEEVWKMLS